ncbi:Hint domain-containing protein [Stenoxybacter acetivorans]|uniref:Hint domain-containing protein n=1 Tax=Stenoxybacter acetivorans TaxID=422441 RepID=UPI001B801C02|nr:Hint domain-containing protein [Stenoxybacter acetivorans]
MKDPGGCFIAGTLVHTKEGLKSIEEIKVGDYVLSMPEDGNSEQAYKRVTKTLQFKEKEVWCVEICPKSEVEQAKREHRLIRQESAFKLIVTPNQPFWVEGMGWTRVDGLFHTSSEHLPQLILSDGEIAMAFWAAPMKRSERSNAAWAPAPDGFDGSYFSTGMHVDLTQGGRSAEFGYLPSRTGSMHDDNGGVDVWKPENIYRCTVYNLEIEDFHTYYVGTRGVWVHNQNCVIYYTK